MDTVEELGQEIACLSAHMDAAAHRLLECIRRFDEACGWQEQGALSCAHWLAWRLGWDPSTAREKVRVARALGMLPAINESLRTARLSYAKVRALTRVATPENEAKLLEMALMATGAQLERLCRGYRGVLDGQRTPEPEERSVRQRLLPGGMVKLELVLEPDEADLILRAIERAREVHARQAEPLETEAAGAPAVAAEPDLPAALGDAEAAEAACVSAETCWPSRADGAVKLAESFLAGNPVTGSGGERFQVMVHLDQEVLGPDGAWAGTLEDGTRVSAEGGIHLTGVGVEWRGGTPPSWPALPQVDGGLRGLVPDRWGLPGLPGVAALAQGFRVPELRPQRSLAAEGRQVHVPRMRLPYLHDSRHNLRPDAHTVDGVVHCLLALCHSQG